MKSELKKLRKDMERVLDAKRYEHTLGVEFTAAALAMRYGASVSDAQIAGLLHDCAKCLPDEKKISMCEKHNISISDVERRNPGLLHAKVGSFLAMEEYEVTDEQIISAILNHTTGRPDMKLLEKILFVADYIEPSRRTAPHLGELRYLAFVDLDQTLLWILEDTLLYLKSSNAMLDPMTEHTYDFYRDLVPVNEKLRSEASAYHLSPENA
ncbi:MAG: bis(5'-nucleosyl)-tetraphosphatase (symmetrical) YqeK [Lachnospiraceae bacterium]|nr:bis(5'-nucleosyl)-tetraphosphatase (symmetrical) YqeK [Lachnospiraceae bacterium]